MKVAVSLISDIAKDKVRSNIYQNKKAFKSFLMSEKSSENLLALKPRDEIKVVEPPKITEMPRRRIKVYQ